MRTTRLRQTQGSRCRPVCRSIRTNELISTNVPGYNRYFLQREMQRVYNTGAPNDNFQENICSEDDLRSRIFETFVVKFLACLPLLGFSNIYEMV